MKLNEAIRQEGEVEVIIDYLNGKQECRHIKNTILQTAKNANALALTNRIGNNFQFYINQIIFGTNGTILDGTPKFVESSRNGLFGQTLLVKNIVTSLTEEALNQAIFTAVIGFAEGNGNVINEMALVMANADLYSMVTMGGITKSSSAQLTFNWKISFV